MQYTSNVYMNGKKLLKIESVGSNGELIGSVVFDSLSRVVNVSDTNIKSYDDIPVTDIGGLFG